MLFSWLGLKRFTVYIVRQTVWWSGLKTWFEVNKNFRFFGCNLHHNKKWVKMMWLSRKSKVLDSFSPKKWEDNTCSMWSGYTKFFGSLTFSLVSLTSTNDVPPHHIKQKNYGSHTIAQVDTIAHVSCCICIWSNWTNASKVQKGNNQMMGSIIHMPHYTCTASFVNIFIRFI